MCSASPCAFTVLSHLSVRVPSLSHSDIYCFFGFLTLRIITRTKERTKTKSSTNRPLLFTGGMEKAKLSFNKLLDNHVNKGGETLCVLHDSAFAFYLTQISRTHPVSRIPVHGMSGSFPADCFSLKKSVHIVLHYTRVVTR